MEDSLMAKPAEPQIPPWTQKSNLLEVPRKESGDGISSSTINDRDSYQVSAKTKNTLSENCLDRDSAFDQSLEESMLRISMHRKRHDKKAESVVYSKSELDIIRDQIARVSQQKESIQRTMMSIDKGSKLGDEEENNLEMDAIKRAYNQA